MFMDISMEYIIKVKEPKNAKIYKVLLLVACCITAFFVFYPIGVLSLAALVVFTILLFRYYDAEYEYLLVDKYLDVDRIMARSSRKKLGSYDLSKLEIMAFPGNERLTAYEQKNCKSYNYASGYKSESEYVIYLNNNNEMIKLIVEPDDRMLEAIKRIGGNKVFLR